MPDTKGHILGSKGGLKLPHRRSDIPKKRVVSRPTKTTGITAPTAEDIYPTLDVQITPEIEELAGELHHDPVEIFAYIRNNIDYQAYYGSVKGSAGTYWEKAGNDFDQASLLIALFRASEIPARYVAGQVELPIEKVMNWVGVKDPEVAAEVFSSNGIPSEAITSADGTVTHLRFFHAWAEAYILQSGRNKAKEKYRWVQMDPSFKQYKYYEGIDIPEAMGLDVDTFYNDALSGATINESEGYFANLNEENITSHIKTYADNLLNWVNTNIPGATVGDVLGYREIKEIKRHKLNTLAQTFPFKTFSPQYEISEIPEDWTYRVIFQMYGFNYAATMPELAGKGLTLSYVPATSYDANLIEAYGGIFNVPAFLVHMKPVLKIDGEVVAEGSGSTLGSSQVLYSSFLRPEGEIWDKNERHLTVGADYAIALDIQKVSLDLIKKRADHLSGLIEGLPPDEPATQEMVEEALHITGLSYFAQVNVLSDVSAKTSKVVWTRHPSQAIVAQELRVIYFFWFPWRVERGSVSIDVKRNILNPTSTTGKHEEEVSWMLSTGSMGSAAEHAIFEQLYGIESVSTEKILALANRWGIPIYTIDSTNVDTILPKLNTFSIVKENIRGAVERGWTAICPQSNITLNNWHGQGWVIVDPETGSAGYMIAGSLVSGSKVITCGGSGTDTVDMITDRIHYYLNQLDGMLAALIGLAGVGVELVIIALASGTPWAIIFATVGVAMVALSIIIFLLYYQHRTYYSLRTFRRTWLALKLRRIMAT